MVWDVLFFSALPATDRKTRSGSEAVTVSIAALAGYAGESSGIGGFLPAAAGAAGFACAFFLEKAVYHVRTRMTAAVIVGFAETVFFTRIARVALTCVVTWQTYFSCVQIKQRRSGDSHFYLRSHYERAGQRYHPVSIRRKRRIEYGRAGVKVKMKRRSDV